MKATVNQIEKILPPSWRRFLKRLWSGAPDPNVDLGPLSRKVLSLARGYFEEIVYDGARLRVRGWLMVPASKIEQYHLELDGAALSDAHGEARPDLAESFPKASHAGEAGFSFDIPLPPERIRGLVELRVSGLAGGEEIGCMRTGYRTDLMTRLPVPPVERIARVDGHDVPSFYMLKGIQNYGELWSAVCRFREPGTIRDMLEWGCGCGRLTGFFQADSGIPHVSGCDIDADAIRWCQENLAPAEFRVNPLYPPTDYGGESFDLVISFSVLTHLTKDDQIAWLAEMQRVLRPGGLFVATVHGELAAYSAFQHASLETILSGEINDETLDGRIGDAAPEGYYRSVFQTQEYTRRSWSPYFEILEYQEGGAGNFQDIVVARKRGGS